MDDKLKREIELNRDERSHIWAFFLLCIGGSFTFLFSLGNLIKIFVGIFGIIISIIIFMFYLKKSIYIDKLIEKSKEK